MPSSIFSEGEGVRDLLHIAVMADHAPNFQRLQQFHAVGRISQRGWEAGWLPRRIPGGRDCKGLHSRFRCLLIHFSAEKSQSLPFSQKTLALMHGYFILCSRWFLLVLLHRRHHSLRDARAGFNEILDLNDSLLVLTGERSVHSSIYAQMSLYLSQQVFSHDLEEY